MQTRSKSSFLKGGPLSSNKKGQSSRSPKKIKSSFLSTFKGKAALSFVAVFAVVGVYTLVQSFAATNPISGNGGEFTPLNPARLVDSRNGTGTTKAPLNPGETRTIQVSGKGGVHSKSSAAALNIAAVGPQAAGYLTAFPADKSRPSTSAVNFNAGQTISNMVQLGLSSDGKVKVYNGSSKAVDFIVDVSGYYSKPDGPNGLRTFRTVYHRAVDTRNTKAIAAKGYTDITIDKTKLHPQSYFQSFEAVQLNLVAVEPTSAGYLTAYPYGVSLPNVSSLNYSSGTTIASAVIVKMGTGNKIRIYNGGSTPIHVVADIAIAFNFRDYDNSVISGKFVPITPFRAFDSRSQNTQYSQGIIDRGEYAKVQVTGKGGVPTGAYGFAANLTTTGSTGLGYITHQSREDISLTNFSPNNTIANAMLIETISGGVLIPKNSSNSLGSTHLIVDIMGYFY